MQMPDFEALKASVVDGDVEKARDLAGRVVESGMDLLQAVEHGFAAGIRRVGDLWEEGEYFLPELVQGAEAMKAAMSILNPAISARRGAQKPRGRVVIGTVHGDLHDIGKTLVGTILSANGFEVHDLGNDVPVDRFIGKAIEVDAHIVAASALLTTTMPVQRKLVEAVASGALPSGTKILVGGAPTTPGWAREIGAAHAENAMRAVAIAESLVA